MAVNTLYNPGAPVVGAVEGAASIGGAIRGGGAPAGLDGSGSAPAPGNGGVSAAVKKFVADRRGGAKIPGTKDASTPRLAPEGAVALDTNAVIAAVEKRNAAVDAAIAGRRPMVPITVAKEFLRGGGDADALRTFLAARGGGVASAGSETTAAGLRAQATGMRRALQLGDSRVAAGAMRDGIPLITQDRKFGNFLSAIGYPVEGF